MIRVLLLSADPKENRPLSLNQEFRRIYNTLSINNQFDVQMRLSATYDDLRKALFTYKPSIIHFSCHGMGEQGLVLVDNNERKEIIDTKTLTELLEICQKANQNIRCIIFNACYGEFQAERVGKHIKYTIGMSNEIKDSHAISFAEVFYQALSLNTTIETAFELGRNSIRCLVHNNSNTVRAEDDPAHEDIIALQPIPDYEIPQLIVNEELDDIYDLDLVLPRQQKLISYKQWDELYSILLQIDFDIVKNVCRDTLKKSVQDIEPKILSLVGSQYPLIIRCLDRYTERSLFSELEKRWDVIREYLGKDKEYLEKKCAYLESVNQTWDDLYPKWQDNNFLSVNIIDKLPVDEDEKIAYFDCFQLSGVPMSLWSRCPEIKYDVDECNCNVEEKFKEILAIESFKSLGEIFKNIHKIRKKVPIAQDKAKDYLGYHLGFICDRPDLIPYNLASSLMGKNPLQGSN